MSMFFRPKANKKEKLFTVFIIISMLAFAYGFLTNIAPSVLIERNTFIASAILCQAYFIPFLMDRHPSNKIPLFSPIKRVLFYLIALLFAFFIAFGLITYSIPSAVTSLIGKPYSFSSTVEGKNKGQKTCKYSVKLEGIGYGIHRGVCVSSSFWETTRIGDKVKAYGLKSAIGIKVTELEHDQ